MHCPKCKAYTAAERLLDVEVDVCPTCQGVWFDRNELSRIVGSPADLRIAEETMVETPYRCPRCFRNLMQVPYTWDQTLLVDLCSGCEGIFLDKGELEKASSAIQAFGAKFPEERLSELRGRNERREALAGVYGTEAPAAKAIEPERIAFLRKVYGLFTATLGLTVGGILAGRALHLHRFWFLWAIASFVLFLILVFGTRRVRGLNLFLLVAFTVVEGLFLSAIVERFVRAGAGSLVLQAFVITLGVFLVLTGTIFLTKKDLSGWGIWLFSFLLVLIVAGIAMIFFRTPAAELVWSVLGALLFCGFILYDTSRIMLKYSTEETVAATLDLYLDFVNLFLDILRILWRLRQ